MAIVLWRLERSQTSALIGTYLGRVDDLDHDGAAEVLVGGHGIAIVCSGRTGAVLRASRWLAGDAFLVRRWPASAI